MITVYSAILHVTWSVFIFQLVFASVNGLRIIPEKFNTATKTESYRNSALSSLSSNGHEYHNDGTNLIEISFAYPSGLLINSEGNSNFCLLQHNVVKLKPSYRRVLQCEGAFSPNTCAQIIREAEICALRDDGWTANRHSAYPTTDLPLEAIFGKLSTIHGLVNGDILPRMASFFGLIEDHLRIGELFVAKYEYGENKQAGLEDTDDEMYEHFSISGSHVDGTPWSFVVSLNDPQTEFTGGGTHFVNECTTYRPSTAGTAVIFSGKNKHMGVPITSGVRYILTGFCNYDNPDFSHRNFMASYDPLYDGFAALGMSGRNANDISTNSRSAFEVSDFAPDSDAEISGHSDGLGMIDTGSGVRTGDLLKGIWVYHSDLTSPEQIAAFRTLKTVEWPKNHSEGTHCVGSELETDVESQSGVYVLTDGLSTEEVMEVVGFSRGSCRACACSVLVHRDNEADEESPRNEVQRNFPRIASRLLSTGKYWSYDECLSNGE